ncbi:MAG: NAD(P)-binding protein, partial [Longimicrobiales bacterium]
MSEADTFDVVIVGAGITGLELGRLLSARNVSYLVFEAAPAPGGVIRSRRVD